MPQELPPGALAVGHLSRQEFLPVASARARAAAGRHLALLSDATARYDELNEGQLGDVLFEDERTVIAIFGSKCGSGGAGKPVAMPAASVPGSGAASLVDSMRCATVQLIAAFRRSWRSLPAASPPPGRAVILPGRLPWQRGRRKCGRSPPASSRHPGAHPPDDWAAVPLLSRDVTSSLQLTCVLSTRAFRALADRTIHTAGGDASSFGSRSMLREEAAALFHAGLLGPPRHAGAAARLRAVGRVTHP